MSYAIHCTKKLLGRIKPDGGMSDNASTTYLGSWYATVLFWRPQLALLVNEQTLLPVLMPLAPASSLAVRFPRQLAQVLTAHGIGQDFIADELTQMSDVQYAKTSNRSVLGVMNQFAYLAEGYRDHLETDDPLTLSLKLSETPCSPLYKRGVSPDRELVRFASDWLAKAV